MTANTYDIKTPQAMHDCNEGSTWAVSTLSEKTKNLLQKWAERLFFRTLFWLL